MKPVNIIVFIMACTLIFTSCTKVTGDGPVVTAQRSVSNFSELAVSIPGDVYFKQDNQYKVEIVAQQNIIDVMQTQVTGNELVIKFKNDVRVKTHDHIIVNVSAPAISSLRISGSGNLRTTGEIHSGDFRMKISGSGNMFIPKLVATNVSSTISGSGDMVVSGGEAANLHLRISGSGSMDLSSLQSRSATTATSGSGTIKINVSETLDVDIAGSGEVYYKGNPVVRTRISGSGKVKPM